MITKAYSPEQSAMGKLEDGRSILILYVKEFEEEYKTVQNKGLSTYKYNWFHNPELNSYILQIEWNDEVHVAIRFDPEHWKLLAVLVNPMDYPLTFTTKQLKMPELSLNKKCLPLRRICSLLKNLCRWRKESS